MVRPRAGGVSGSSCSSTAPSGQPLRYPQPMLVQSALPCDPAFGSRCSPTSLPFTSTVTDPRDQVGRHLPLPSVKQARPLKGRWEPCMNSDPRVSVAEPRITAFKVRTVEICSPLQKQPVLGAMNHGPRDISAWRGKGQSRDSMSPAAK